jgi:hypothetical protein
MENDLMANKLLESRMHELVAREVDLIYFYRQGAEILDLNEEDEIDNDN